MCLRASAQHNESSTWGWVGLTGSSSGGAINSPEQEVEWMVFDAEDESADLTETSLPWSIHPNFVDVNSKISKNAYRHASEKIASGEVRFTFNLQMLWIFTLINVSLSNWNSSASGAGCYCLFLWCVRVTIYWSPKTNTLDQHVLLKWQVAK